MLVTFKHCKNRRAFPGVHPLNSIAADNRIFPAGMSLINGWLFQVHSWPQWLQCCLILIKVSICWVISASQYWWHDLQAMNRLSRWDLYTRNLTSSWCCGSWVSSLCDITEVNALILLFVAVCMLILLCNLHNLSRMKSVSVSVAMESSSDTTSWSLCKGGAFIGYIMFQCFSWQAESVFLLIINGYDL